MISAAGNGDASGAQPDSIVAGDFNGDGDTDIAFATDDGLADVMLATSGGSMGSATSLTLPSGHLAIGVDHGRLQRRRRHRPGRRGQEHQPRGGGGSFVGLDLLTGNGSGGFSYTSTYQTVGQPDMTTPRPGRRRLPGLHHGPRGRRARHQRRRLQSYVDVVPLSTSGTWGRNSLLASTDDGDYRDVRRLATSSPPTSTAPASRASP